jgi:hypothetical protein
MWVWDRYEGAYDALKGSVLYRPACVEAIGRTNLDANRLAEELRAFQTVPSSVALLYSPISNVYTAGHKPRLNQAYAAASSAGVEVDIVTEAMVQDGGLAEYDLVVLPRPTHVESATVTAAASAVDGDVNCIVVGRDSLARSPYDAPHGEGDHASVIDGSTVVQKGADEERLRTTVSNAIADRGLRDVVVSDESGAPASGVEWRSVVQNGRRLVNVANYTLEDRQLQIEIDGATTGDGRDLVEQTDVTDGSLELGPEEFALLAFPQ